MVITAKIVFGCFHSMKVWGYCIYVEFILKFWILGLGSWVDIKMWVFIHCVILVLVFAHSRRIGDLITATTGECAYKRTVNNSITLQSTKAPSIHWRANVFVCVCMWYIITLHTPPSPTNHHTLTWHNDPPIIPFPSSASHFHCCVIWISLRSLARLLPLLR